MSIGKDGNTAAYGRFSINARPDDLRTAHPTVQVHDPLLEAGKAKWNKQQAKLKKRTETAGWRGGVGGPMD